MKMNKSWYNVINLAVLLITACIFVEEYFVTDELPLDYEFGHIAALVFAVIIVHFIKAARLYLSLYGTNIELFDYIKIYCKVTPVSVVFPFKTGEFFRMYCYGRKLKNFLKGIVVVLLDRFMDTAALVTIILLIWLYNGGRLDILTYALLLFLILALLLYLIFPGVYKFWKSYILRVKATEHKLAILKILESLNSVYAEITTTAKGRGIILYFMSLISWTVEIGFVVLLSGMDRDIHFDETIAEYLSSALGNGTSVELRQFVFASVVLMLVVYVAIKGFEIIIRKRDAQ